MNNCLKYSFYLFLLFLRINKSYTIYWTVISHLPKERRKESNKEKKKELI